MRELTPTVVAKLDEDLQRILTRNVLDESSTMPVTIRCSSEHITDLTSRVREVGGTVRHQLKLVGAVAAWVPLAGVPELARDERVSSIELEQQFTLA